MTMTFKPAASCTVTGCTHNREIRKARRPTRARRLLERLSCRPWQTRILSRLESLYTPELRFGRWSPRAERLGQHPAETVHLFRRWFGAAHSPEMSEFGRPPGLRPPVPVLSIPPARPGQRLEGDRAAGLPLYRRAAGLINECRWPAPASPPTRTCKPCRPLRPCWAGAFLRVWLERLRRRLPFDDISNLIRPLAAGQTLEIHATDPSVAADLSAWCRLSGPTLLNRPGIISLIQHN